MARSIERGYDIGIFAPIRVEWWLAHGHARTNSLSSINRGAAPSQPGTPHVRRDDVASATGENSRSSSSFAPTDRGRLAAPAVRAFIRSARSDCASAKAFRGKHHNRTGTATHITRSHHANFSGGDEPNIGQRV